MASNITLSAGVRQNLLALQNTASLLSTTQNRLATGKKVNSALDNPTNFFTSSALTARASDLSAILDSMSNGIKTLQAADNGLTAITHTVESMQATITQARQDSSFKSNSYTVDSTTIGTTTSKVLSISGGAVGTTAVNVALQSNTGGTIGAGTAAVVNGAAFSNINFSGSSATAGTLAGGAFSALNLSSTAATAGTYDAGNFAAVDLSHTAAAATSAVINNGAFTAVDFTNSGSNDGQITFNLNVDGAGATPVTIGYADVHGTVGNDAAVTGSELASIINTKYGSNVASWDAGNTRLVFTSPTTGSTSSLQVTGFSATNGATGSGIANTAVVNGTDAVAADSITFTLKVDSTTQAITLNNATAAANHAAVTGNEIASAINTQFGSNVATFSGGKIHITSATTGVTSTVDITNFATTGNATTSGLANTSQTGSAATSNSVSFTLKVDNTTHAITLDNTTAAANHAAVTGSEVATAINSQFGSNVATFSGGALHFTSATTGTSSTVDITSFATVGSATTSGIANGSNAGSAATAASIAFNLSVDGTSHAITLNNTITAANVAAVTGSEVATAINTQFGSNVATFSGGALHFTSPTTGSSSSVAISGFTAAGGATGSGISNTSANGTNGAITGGTTTVLTVDQLVASINANTSLTGKVKASNDNGKLSIQNLSTEDLSLAGIGSTSGQLDGSAGTGTVGGNTVRKGLITQFNQLRTQLDKIADDASFNGVNLLHGDTLKLIFNETNTSSISIVSQDPNGINTSVLGVTSADGTEFSSNNALDTRLDNLHNALTQLRSQASAFGSNLSIVQNRQDFTKNMINTLQTGSDNLVLADSNEEAANLLALQTRQQLSTTALSLANQSEQAVLRLF